jgi:hypothetical protein
VGSEDASEYQMVCVTSTIHEPIFEQIEAILGILQRHNFPQVDVVGKIIRYFNRGDIDKAVATLNSVNFWGGAGSVFDITIYDELGTFCRQQQVKNLACTFA